MQSHIEWSTVSSVPLPELGSAPAGIHIFDEHSNLAIQAALAARRPLLVRGEPGTGKSQLARAAAAHLKCPLVSCTVDGQTESRELLWSVDSVARLAAAQLAAVVATRRSGVGDADSAARPDPSARTAIGSLDDLGDLGDLGDLDDLDERRYLRPGPLWWAFDWQSAKDIAQTARVQVPTPPMPAGWDASQRVVVLIDEIDKADSSVPNGLLEALGSGHFSAPAMPDRITMKGQVPLVIVSTNEERALPDAFLRRCLVLRLELPEAAVELADFLITRGAAHFPACEPEVLRAAAEAIAAGRADARKERQSPPGQAEYLDLLRAVCANCTGSRGRVELLGRVKGFFVDKHKRSEGGV